MTICCGLCNHDIEVADDIVDGQHVRCPYCGGKTAYRAPSRVVLPTAVRPVAEPVAAPSKPNLHIIRKEEPKAEKGDVRKIHMAEERAQFYQGLRNAEGRRKALQTIVSVSITLGLVLVGVFSYVYLSRRHDEAERVRVQLEREREQQRIEREEYEKELREKTAREEAMARERRLAAEKARKQAEEEARQREERIQREGRERYREIITFFESGTFAFLSDAAFAERAQVPGESFYLLPFGDAAQPTFTVVSLTNGAASVYRLMESGERQSEEAEAFFKSIEAREYLVAHEGRVFFRSLRKKPHVAQIPMDKTVNLRDELFGTLAPEIARFDFDFETIQFEIDFVPAGSTKPIVSEVVEYGAPYSLEKVREAVEDAYPQSAVRLRNSQAVRKFKRTTVFWEGAHIKRGVDGVTYVPRSPPAAAYGDRYSHHVYGCGWKWANVERLREKRAARAEQTRDQWQALCDKATQEDAEEKAFYEKQSGDRRAELEKKGDAARAAYVRRIDGILAKGRLFWRVKTGETNAK